MERKSCQVRCWALVWNMNGVMTGTFRLTARQAVDRWTTARLNGQTLYIGRMSETWVKKVADLWSNV